LFAVNCFAINNDLNIVDNYLIHVDLTGTPAPGQKVFYNIKNLTTNQYVVPNTVVTGNSIDESGTLFKKWFLDCGSGSESFVMTIYNLEYTNGGANVPFAIPIYFQATWSQDPNPSWYWRDGETDFTNSATINPLVQATISGPDKLLDIVAAMDINLVLPYTSDSFLSVKNSLQPKVYSKDYKLPNDNS
jgi:hypothetical protein